MKNSFHAPCSDLGVTKPGFVFQTISCNPSGANKRTSGDLPHRGGSPPSVIFLHLGRGYRLFLTSGLQKSTGSKNSTGGFAKPIGKLGV